MTRLYTQSSQYSPNAGGQHRSQPRQQPLQQSLQEPMQQRQQRQQPQQPLQRPQLQKQPQHQQRQGAQQQPASTAKPLTRYTWISLLRAYGVVLVLMYHFFPQLLPGGFIGVDVFFVFSGYLISSLLIKEFQENSRIGLLDFYKRRIRRLFPALVAMLLVALPLSLLISPDFRVDLARQTAAALAWVTNFYEILNGGSYANALLPHLFVHTWTLSVEMQYYLVWGAALCLLLPMFLGKNGGRPNIAQSVKMIIKIAIVLAVLSFIAMQLLLIGADDPSVAYYSTISHLYPLMIGSIAGAVAGFFHSRTVQFLERIRPRVAIAATVVCLAGITALALFLDFGNLLVYHFGILLTSLLVAVVVLLGRGAQRRLAKYQEPELLLYLADRSYSLYLFHWPILIIVAQWGKDFSNLVAPQLADLIGILAAIIALGLTFLSAHLSYKYVERPFAHRRQSLARSASDPGQRATSSDAGEQPGNHSGRQPGHRHQRYRSTDSVQNRRPKVVYGAFGVLIIAAFGALIFASPITSIEQKYQQGQLILDVNQLDNTHQAFVLVAQSDDRNGVPGPRIVPGSISVIGDSVTLGAVNEVSAYTGAQIDAAINRAMVNGIAQIEAMEQNAILGEIVVVALATNSHGDSYESALEIISNLEPGHRLIFVTAHGDSGMYWLNDLLRALPPQYPFVTIADWNLAIQGREDLLAADRIHLEDQESREIYAQTIQNAIQEAKQKPTT